MSDGQAVNCIDCEQIPGGPVILCAYHAQAGAENARLRALNAELLKALKHAEPATWMMATSTNADAIKIHQEVKTAIAHAEDSNARER